MQTSGQAKKSLQGREGHARVEQSIQKPASEICFLCIEEKVKKRGNDNSDLVMVLVQTEDH